MARLSIGGGRPAKVSIGARAPNLNRDRSLTLRAPRLKPLGVGTRDYSKPEMGLEQPPRVGGGGFGSTGMTGET